MSLKKGTRSYFDLLVQIWCLVDEDSKKFITRNITPILDRNSKGGGWPEIRSPLCPSIGWCGFDLNKVQPLIKPRTTQSWYGASADSEKFECFTKNSNKGVATKNITNFLLLSASKMLWRGVLEDTLETLIFDIKGTWNQIRCYSGQALL